MILPSVRLRFWNPLQQLRAPVNQPLGFGKGLGGVLFAPILDVLGNGDFGKGEMVRIAGSARNQRPQTTQSSPPDSRLKFSRICSKWMRGNVCEVEIVDYH
jgi:hypothetical protein